MRSILPLVTAVIACARSSSQLALSPCTGDTCGVPQPVGGCCIALKAAGLTVLRPQDDEYQSRIESYFSVSARLEPGCIVQPTTAEEVSLAVTTLTKKTKCDFAIRGGGHTAFPGAANIKDGVTLDFGLMRETTYDPETKVAKIQPGTTWATVYGDLEPYNVTVAGGRTGTVGIGGFLLGGGNTFYAAREGFGCDNVVNYEIVLANGKIVNANAKKNADLFKALKGGGSNFGVVTRFDMKAIDAGLFWGGLVTYKATQTDAFVNAYHKWTNNIENYTNGSVIPFWSYMPDIDDDVILLAYEDVNGVEAAPAFDDFMAIGDMVSSTMRITTHKELADELEIAEGYRNIVFSITFKNEVSLFHKTLEIRKKFIKDWKAQSPDGDFFVHGIFQSIPALFARHGVEKGGNVMGLDRVTDNAMLFQIQMMVKGECQEAKARRRLQAFREELKQYTVDVGLDVEWEYLNYAELTQDPLRTYGADNVKFLKKVALKYDPQEIFQTRVPGGFKISHVEL